MVFLQKRECSLAPFTSPFMDLDEFIRLFFYDWPQSDTKPPMSVRPIYKEKNLIGAQVEVAVAGYRKEDLNVSLEGDKLYIYGDNRERDISERFKSRFEKKVVLQKNLDTSKIDIKFEDGILSVYIPMKEIASEKKLLFGKE